MAWSATSTSTILPWSAVSSVPAGGEKSDDVTFHRHFPLSAKEFCTLVRSLCLEDRAERFVELYYDNGTLDLMRQSTWLKVKGVMDKGHAGWSLKKSAAPLVNAHAVQYTEYRDVEGISNQLGWNTPTCTSRDFYRVAEGNGYVPVAEIDVVRYHINADVYIDTCTLNAPWGRKGAPACDRAAQTHITLLGCFTSREKDSVIRNTAFQRAMTDIGTSGALDDTNATCNFPVRSKIVEFLHKFHPSAGVPAVDERSRCSDNHVIVSSAVVDHGQRSILCC
jgi:hypothetical protein